MATRKRHLDETSTNNSLTRTLLNINKIKEQNKTNFHQRLLDVNRQYIPDWESNKIATHKLSWATDDNGNAIIYPEVQEINGKLIDFTRPPYNGWVGYNSAMQRGDTILTTPNTADLYTRTYKNLYPKGTTFVNNRKRRLKDGGIYIKPSHRGRFTELKERTGHSTSWFIENGTPTQKKMAVFANNARKWKH